jgi:hypothetical protein
MKMSKFNVGDKVRIVLGYPLSARRDDTQHLIGKEVRIEDCNIKEDAYAKKYGSIFYHVTETNYEYDEGALELVSKKNSDSPLFKVGSIVRLKKSATLCAGREDGISTMPDKKRLGVITNVNPGSYRVFTVGKILSCHSWCFWERELEEVTDE